ncbi:Gellan lyase precursor [compost metagenome]
MLKLHFKAKAVTQTVTGSVYLTNVVVSDGNGIETTLNNGAAYQVQIIFVDKAALQALLISTQALHDAAVEGAGIGKYPIGAKANLQTAIDSAQAVANQSAATQLQVDQAIQQLHVAVQTFTASANVGIVGDLNGDGKFSIGDLGIVAAGYGSRSDDPNWHLYQQADIINDGIIDILDLAAVARLIIG